MVTQMSHAGVRPLQIQAALLQETKTPSSAALTTLYNHQDQMRREQLEGRSPIEALIYEIHHLDFYYIIHNEDSEMNALFFSHPHSL